MICVIVVSQNWFWTMFDFGFAWTRQLLSLTMPEEQSKGAATKGEELRAAALASAPGPRPSDASNRPAAGAPAPAGSVLTEEKLKELLGWGWHWWVQLVQAKQGEQNVQVWRRGQH